MTITSGAAAPGGAVGTTGCTASLIQDDLLVTARHCACNAGTTPLSFSIPGQTTAAINGFLDFAMGGPGIVCDDDVDYESGTHDLALIRLVTPVPATAIPFGPLGVYTNRDFIARRFNDINFLASQNVTQVGFANTQTRRSGSRPGNQYLMPGVDACDDCDEQAYYISYPNDSRVGAQGGDSGGPHIFFNAGKFKIFGAHKGRFDENTTGVATPTFTNGTIQQDIGFIIEQRLTEGDLDNDGVNDGFDNCAPSKFDCRFNLASCFNPRPPCASNSDCTRMGAGTCDSFGFCTSQPDRDQDGVGDTCDNCPPELCEARGNTVAVCANPGAGTANDQRDTDNDGWGDICDSCPEDSQPKDPAILSPGDQLPPRVLAPQLGDPDGDGVGIRCDNCKQFNGFKACRGVEDCRFSGSGISGGVLCSDLRVWPGRCSIGNTACETAADCPPSSSCLLDGPYGTCMGQTDDADRDGVGQACDSCPSVANAWPGSTQSNSNTRAEQRELPGLPNETARGDVCDAVPIYVPRPIVVPIEIPPPPSTLPPDSAVEVTAFYATAQFGVRQLPNDAINVNPEPPPDSFHDVGFRWCNCSLLGQVFDEERCFQLFCSDRPEEYESSTLWSAVTVASSGALTGGFGNALPPLLPFGDEVSRRFSGDKTCNDDYMHPGGAEPCRLGEPELLFWKHQVDIDAGRAASIGPHQTVGLFWSHVLPTTFGISNRDEVSRRRMRDTYTYVRTPLISPVCVSPPNPGPPLFQASGAAAAQVQQAVAQPCNFDRCDMIYRPDLVLNPRAPSGTSVGIDQSLSHPARLHRNPDSTFTAFGSILSPQVVPFNPCNYAPALSGQVKQLATSQMAWLTPVETGVQTRISGSEIMAVGMPVQWSANSRPAVVSLSNGSLQVTNETDAGLCCAAGEVLMRCATGLRCSVACNGAIGDDLAAGVPSDASCEVLALLSEEITDEDSSLCLPPVGASTCGAGEIACHSDCVRPCDGSVECLPNGRIGDENGLLCGPGCGAPLARDARSEGGTREVAFAATSQLRPGERVGAKSILSATERAVYMVGGDFEPGRTSEIWRYGLDSGAWQLLGTHGLGKILGVAYNPSRAQLLILDDFTPSRRLRRGVEDDISSVATSSSVNTLLSRRVRLLMFDTKSQTLTGITSWPRLVERMRAALVAEPTGGFALVIWDPDKPFADLFGNWSAFHFQLQGTRIKWDGKIVGKGMILDAPFAATEGVLVSVRQLGKHDFIGLSSWIPTTLGPLTF